MRYKFTGSGIIDIVSTDKFTDDNRWQLLSPYQMKNFFPKNNWGWFNEILIRDNEITSLALGYDKFIKRPILAKTVNYRIQDMQTIESINLRRRVLIEQVKILNDLQCPLLPEALDWFTIENIQDPIKYDECIFNEPILILDYIPGVSMSWSINSGKFKRNFDEKESIFESKYNDLNDVVDIQKVGRVALKILYFIKYLTNRNYTNMALTPDHVLLLKDDTTRFVGIGRICKTINGRIDMNHINSNKTIYGYSAPELNDWTSGRREKADGKKIALFSLGVLIHQMVIGTTEFKSEMLKGPSFIYPNNISESLIKGKGKSGRTLHNLISKLCCHDEDYRLDNIDEIEKELLLLSSMYISGEEGKKIVTHSLIGTIKTFNSDKLYGEIEAENHKIYQINSHSLNNLSKEDIKLLISGVKIQFEGTEKADILGNNKAYANNIAIIEKPQNVAFDKTYFMKDIEINKIKKESNEDKNYRKHTFKNDNIAKEDFSKLNNKFSSSSKKPNIDYNDFEKWKDIISNLIEKTFK